MNKLLINTVFAAVIPFSVILFVGNFAQAEPNVSCPAGTYPVCDDEVGCWCKQSSGGSGHQNWVIIQSMSTPIYKSINETKTFDLVIRDLTEEEMDELLLVLELQSEASSR